MWPISPCPWHNKKEWSSLSEHYPCGFAGSARPQNQYLMPRACPGHLEIVKFQNHISFGTLFLGRGMSRYWRKTKQNSKQLSRHLSRTKRLRCLLKGFILCYLLLPNRPEISLSTWANEPCLFGQQHRQVRCGSSFWKSTNSDMWF